MSSASKQPKFTEAHGKGSRACVLWDNEGRNIITAGADARIVIHKDGGESLVPSVLHTKAVTALVISPNGLLLASGSLDHAVKLYSYPCATFQTNVTRFNLPIRALAFSVTGGLLAAAGDDDGIKILSTVDYSIVRVLKGHDAPVVSLAFDPKNEYLASVGTDGTLMIWSLDTGARIHILKHAAPEVDSEDLCSNQISWHPTGDILAVPGHQFDVVMYDRDTAEVHFRLRGGHNTSIGFLAWSPNGKYLATAGDDRKIMLWDVENRLDLDRLKVPLQICSLAWQPSGNALALIDGEGKYGVWQDAIPAHLPSPSAMEKISSLVTKQELLHFSDDEAEEKASASGSEDDIMGAEVDLMEDSDEEETLLKKAHGERKKSKGPGADEAKPYTLEGTKIKRDCKPDLSHPICNQKPRPEKQKAFQPGVTKQVAGSRRFLTYNLLGCIITSEGEGVNHVEVEFHDISRGQRIAPLADYFGFTIAALGEKGSVLANPSKDKTPSTLVYRPFSSWASNSEWSMRFPSSEEVRSVAVGDGWIAAGTSLDYLRIYSEAGQQRFVLSLTGPVVTMNGYLNFLAVVTHASDPLDCGQQVLSFSVLDMTKSRQTLTGPLPVTPGADLTWFGFSETGSLASFDSKGVLRMWSRMYGGCWVPVYSSPEEHSSSEALWMVGLNETQIFCIKCEGPNFEPQVLSFSVLDMTKSRQTLTGPLPVTPGADLTWFHLVRPKPVLSIVSPAMPIVHSDLGASDMEKELLWKSYRLEELRANAVDPNDDEDEQLLRTEAEQDRCLLRLIAACCHGDKLARAWELARMLSLHKSLEGAIKLVSSMRLLTFAERLSSLLEERRKAERASSVAEHPSTSVLPNFTQAAPEAHKFIPLAKSAKPILRATVQSKPSQSETARESTPGEVANQAVAVETTRIEVEKPSLEVSDQVRQEHRMSSSPRKQADTGTKSLNPFAKNRQSDSKDGSVMNALRKIKDTVGLKRTGMSDQKPAKRPPKSLKVA